MKMHPSLTSAPDSNLGSAARLRSSDPIHWELREFLEDEAQLLDEERLDEWLKLLADDMRYWMPVRVSVNRELGDGFAKRMGIYNDSKSVLEMRVRRILGTTSAWVEDPPSRISRFISGVRIFRTDKPDEFIADSNILLARSRSDQGEVKLITARRHDVLRRSEPGSTLIARREIYINQTSIDMHNFAIFL